MKKLPKSATLFAILFIFLLICFVADILFGAVKIPLSEIIYPQNATFYEIIYNFRLPKALTACVVGAAISLSGLIMQTLFRNPLAGPYVLGVSSGASLGVALFLMAGAVFPFFAQQQMFGMVFSAAIGAISILFLILLVSARIKSSVSLLIIGLMFGQIASSLVSILQNYSNPDALKLFIVWTFGSLSAVTWEQTKILFPLIGAGILLIILLQKSLDGLLIGENYARTLGIRLQRTRILIIVATVLLAGVTTAFTGPIAFLGVAVPHIARGLFGTSKHKIIIWGTLLCGAILLILCDLASQISADGYTLPINAISALVGAPLIIWIILKNRKRSVN